MRSIASSTMPPSLAPVEVPRAGASLELVHPVHGYGLVGEQVKLFFPVPLVDWPVLLDAHVEDQHNPVLLGRRLQLVKAARPAAGTCHLAVVFVGR